MHKIVCMEGLLTVGGVKLKFGELIRLLRKRQGLTQDELGNKLNLSRITIQNVEAGRNATMDTMLLLMQHFEVMSSYNELLETWISDNSYDSLY